MRRKAMLALMLLGAISAPAQKPETGMLEDGQRLYDNGKYADAEIVGDLKILGFEPTH